MPNDTNSNSQLKAAETELKETIKGISTNPVKDWKEFYDLIFQKFCWKERNNKNETNEDGKPYINDYVWRGHRCESWELKSSFDRDSGRSDLRRHNNSFAYACRNKLGEFGINMREFLEWIRKDTKRVKHLWALGQHYGLKTPFLDWCYSPFVAAFFAFEGKTIAEDFAEDKLKEICCILKSNGSIAKKDFVEELKERAENRAVIGLNINHLKKFRKENSRYLPWKIPTLDYFDPMSSEYPRLINQRGLFTITKNGEAVEDIVRKNWANGGENEPPWIVKILIPNDNRAEFLRALNLMDINHMTLFPEIYGAAKFCNIGIEDGLNDYAVFHGQGV